MVRPVDMLWSVVPDKIPDSKLKLSVLPLRSAGKAPILQASCKDDVTQISPFP